MGKSRVIRRRLNLRVKQLLSLILSILIILPTTAYGLPGFGLQIYDRTGAGTHTWDSSTYPDGTPGPAPIPPGKPSGDPDNPDNPNDPTPDNPSDPENPGTPNGGYNITIIKFYENNNTPESNFTRENNPGSIQVEDEPIYHLVDWFYSPDRIDPPSQSTAYDDTKVSALITETGTTPTTVTVVQPDTTLYLKLVKQDTTPNRPEAEFVLKESEITKAYNSQQVKATGWQTGSIYHWEGSTLKSGDPCKAIIGWTCDCSDDDCSGCVPVYCNKTFQLRDGSLDGTVRYGPLTSFFSFGMIIGKRAYFIYPVTDVTAVTGVTEKCTGLCFGLKTVFIL